MNLYEGAISGPADERELSLGSQRLDLPADLGHRRPGLVAGEGRKVVVGIRPEHLTVTENDSANGETLAARVELVEALGNESLVHFSTDARRVRNRGGAWMPDAAVQASGAIAGAAAAEGVARLDPRVRVAPGDRVTLAVEVDRLHFFDAETGDAIGASAT
jgi:multiple sugar transport system ATP-binding protein